MKQTAIDYLVKELPTIYWEDSYYSDLFERVKEMEKQQIEDAYDKGFLDAMLKYRPLTDEKL